MKHLGGFEAEGFNPVGDALARTEQDRCDVEGELGNRNSAISFVSGPCRLPGTGGGEQGGLNDCRQRGEVGVGGYHHRDRPREDAEEDLKAR